LTAYITADNRSDVRIGKYFTVPYPDHEKLFVRVAELSYVQQFATDDANEIHAQRALRTSGVDETDYKFLARLDPIAVIAGGKRRMPDRIPKPNASVERAKDKNEIKTGLNIPGDGVFIGHLSVGGDKVRTNSSPPTIDYCLRNEYGDADPLIFRHLLIAGGTGSGKSHTAKNILRQFSTGVRYEMDDGRSARPSIVVFDPQNEYAQMHDDNSEVEDEDTKAWDAEGIEYGGHDDTIAFVPKVDGYSYDAENHRASQVEFSIPFEMVEDNKWLLAGADLSENQQIGLNLLLRDYFGEADDPSYAGFTDFVLDVTREDYYVEQTGRIHEATYNALKRKVADNPVFDRVFDCSADPITDDSMLKKFVRSGGVSVVPTYHITNSRAEEVVVLALASLVVDNKLSTGGKEVIKETPLVLAMDEAHNFLAETDTAQGRRIKGKFSEAAKQGRKERLGLFLITQDPGDIADPVFKQINTKVVLNLGDEQAIQSVNIPKELEDKVPYMEKGQMVVYSPDNSEPVEVIGLPKCVTKHS
ncbi:MAG: ATP-binding protein, partial [Halobacteria archaeon]|nr:ATP-binding protein [Halobacteria archaeon]